jgi:iron complex transport system substrate-binding protein
VVGRAYEGSVSSGLYISGRDGFYTDLIGLIGGVNAHSGLTIALPNISVEGLIKLDPEVIFEVINADDPIKAKEALATWDKYPAISAVKNKRVFVLADDFASIPGPRFVLLAEQMADLVC